MCEKACDRVSECAESREAEKKKKNDESVRTLRAAVARDEHHNSRGAHARRMS